MKIELKITAPSIIKPRINCAQGMLIEDIASNVHRPAMAMSWNDLTHGEQKELESMSGVFGTLLHSEVTRLLLEYRMFQEYPAR